MLKFKEVFVSKVKIIYKETGICHIKCENNI